MVGIPDKRYFRPDEVAAIIEEPIRSVYRWIKAGLIRHVRHGRKTRIAKEEIERILREGVR